MPTHFSSAVVLSLLMASTIACVAAILLVLAMRLARRIRGASMQRLTDRIRPAILQTAVAEQDELDDSLAVFRSLRGRARRSAESMVIRMLYDVTGETRTNLTHILTVCGTITRAVARTTSTVPVRRARAAETLGLIDYPEAITALLAALPSSSGVPAVIVGSALLEIAQYSAAAIGRGFADKDPAVRRTTAILASHVMSPGAIPSLITAVTTDDEPLVRIAAARSLTRLQTREAVPALHAAAASQHPGVRIAATAALASFPTAWTAGALAELRQDPNVDIRRAASATPIRG
jgi:HEAT repeat protein